MFAKCPLNPPILTANHGSLNALARNSIPASSPPSPNPSSRISPAVLFSIVIIALIFFISGLLHLLVRFLIRKSPSPPSSPWQASAAELSGSEALQRQLQQLFHLHDSGLDQELIDALPVFLYREIMGSKEPFDCAVCLCEFEDDDKLRLLPLCGHAFHISCIDTWLLSNSTCPLCRGALYVQGLGAESLFFGFEDYGEQGQLSDERDVEGDENAGEKRLLFPVRLGNFKNLGCVDGGSGNNEACQVSGCEQGECSSSNLDARRCFSMGSYQYVVAETSLQVRLDSGSVRKVINKAGRGRGMSGNSTSTEVLNGKRLSIASKGESLSVSKIWQWSNKKGKFAVTSDVSSPDGNFQWVRNNVTIHE